VRWHQNSHLYANTRIGHLRNNFRTSTKRLKFLLFLYLVFFAVVFFSVLLISPSLFSYPYSYSLHFPSFSCTIIHCLPVQLLFLPLFIHSLIFTSCSYPSPTCHHTIPLSYTLTTQWLAYCTNYTQPQPLQSLTQAHSTTATEIYLNMHKGHKTQQPL
jgi:hypothetical protein